MQEFVWPGVLRKHAESHSEHATHRGGPIEQYRPFYRPRPFHKCVFEKRVFGDVYLVIKYIFAKKIKTSGLIITDKMDFMSFVGECFP